MDLKLGRYQDVLRDVECDAIVVDSPYSARVHEGHDDGAAIANKARRRKANGVLDTGRARREINYEHWSAAEVDEFVDFWVPRCRGWFVCLSNSELCSTWRAAFEHAGRTGFQPLPILIPGMTVRMAGDGPSSWAVYANVARPKRAPFSTWGTLPGGYTGPVGRRERASSVVGGKPLWLMRALIRDYSRPGDLIVDPCAGGARPFSRPRSRGDARSAPS